MNPNDPQQTPTQTPPVAPQPEVTPPVAPTQPTTSGIFNTTRVPLTGSKKTFFVVAVSVFAVALIAAAILFIMMI